MIDIQQKLKLHSLWLNGDCNGSRANLSGANLSGADLSGANLSRADLSGANLSGADLSGANLSGADLSGANLSWANLSLANLSLANLSLANLSGANLSRANLPGGGLAGTSICGLKWRVYLSPDRLTLSIGCQSHAVEKWAAWNHESPDISGMHSEASGWWKENKPLVMAFCGVGSAEAKS